MKNILFIGCSNRAVNIFINGASSFIVMIVMNTCYLLGRSANQGADHQKPVSAQGQGRKKHHTLSGRLMMGMK